MPLGLPQPSRHDYMTGIHGLSVYSSCLVFSNTDEDMDGEAVCTALASCPGPDCLKDIIKKAGPQL